jgi:hypothetical protein
MADGRMVVQLYDASAGIVIASISVPNGSFATLSGVVDIPAGTTTIELRAYPEDVDGWGDYNGAGLQVILGQTVAEQGCIQPDGCT